MIYLDNSATTNPKPFSVIRASDTAIKNFSFNSGRGGYSKSISTAQKIFDVREKASRLVGCQPQNVIFTHNCTLAINMAIKGLVKKGDHILISNFEHNAVLRPVYDLATKGIISFDIFDYDIDDDKLINNIKALIKRNTRLIVCTQASNVFGYAFPLEKIGELAKSYGISFVVDGAQGAGIFDFKCNSADTTAYCVAGHKGLYGTLSTGFLALADGVKLDTIIEGGTGSSSLNPSQPDFLPDRLESGSLNNSGIIALGAGIDFVNGRGINNIYNHEFNLISEIFSELEKNKSVTLYTQAPLKYKSAPIISFNFKDYSSEKTANLLAERGVAVRAGYHCAYLAHRTMGTYDRGTVRISPSVFTNRAECEKFLNYLKKL